MTITWLRDRAVDHAITTISKLKQFIPHDGIVRPAIHTTRAAAICRARSMARHQMDPDRRLAWARSSRVRRYGARLTRDRRSYHRDEDETARQSRPKIQMTGKVRGRSRVTGNLSPRSRPLAPPQHHPRIAIAGDFPRGAAIRHLSTRQ